MVILLVRMLSASINQFIPEVQTLLFDSLSEAFDGIDNRASTTNSNHSDKLDWSIVVQLWMINLVSEEMWLLTAVLPASSLEASTDMAAADWAKSFLREQLMPRPLDRRLWNVCSLAHQRDAAAPPQRSRFITIGVCLVNKTLTANSCLSTGLNYFTDSGRCFM